MCPQTKSAPISLCPGSDARSPQSRDRRDVLCRAVTVPYSLHAVARRQSKNSRISLRPSFTISTPPPHCVHFRNVVWYSARIPDRPPRAGAVPCKEPSHDRDCKARILLFIWPVPLPRKLNQWFGTSRFFFLVPCVRRHALVCLRHPRKPTGYARSVVLQI
jgi:hypothetical protein